MVILAASILSKSGKILFSRQSVDMPRYRIEGYVREFMHLMTTGEDKTYFEGENVSYVYKPIESLYLLIVTNKQTNIIAEKDTLMLLSRLVSEKSSSLDEKGICDSTFELVFAFDEVINPGGYTDDVDFAQVLTNLDMCSVKETSHILETQKKVDKTKEVMKQKAREIDKKKETAWDSEKNMRQGEPEFGFLGNRDTRIKVLHWPDYITDDASTATVECSGLPPKPVKGSGSGLWLHSDKGKEVTKYLEGLKAEGEFVKEEQSSSSDHQSEPTALLPTDSDSVLFFAEEHIDVTRRSSENIFEFDLHGTLGIQIPAHLGVVSEVQIDTENPPGLYFQPVPNIHRGLFAAQNTLLLGNLYSKSKEQPDSGVCILDWKMENADISLLPLLVDCLPTPTALYIRYEASAMSNLRNVLINVLIPNLPENSIIKSSPGKSWYDEKESTVNWSIPLIQESNKSTGTLEIHDPPEAPLPFPSISVDFTTENILSKLKVIKIVPKKSEDPTTFVQHSELSTHKYMVFP